VTGADGTQTTATGPALRKALGLRSTWFTVGRLALTPPPTPVTYGGAASLVGAARNVGPVSLEARAAGGQWQTVAPLTPDGAGTVSTIVKPQATTEYRLAAGLVHAALVKVPVAPLVSATIKDGSATGTILPAVAGASVQLQRQDGAVWTTVASGATDTTGAFALVGPTPPALATAYRVRAAPGHGLVPGFSQPACC
jgi:hypothetical protein